MLAGGVDASLAAIKSGKGLVRGQRAVGPLDWKLKGTPSHAPRVFRSRAGKAPEDIIAARSPGRDEIEPQLERVCLDALTELKTRPGAIELRLVQNQVARSRILYRAIGRAIGYPRRVPGCPTRSPWTKT
jgi:hypothetical protein